MDTNISLDTTVGKVSSQGIPQAITKDMMGEGLANVKQGDRISGKVIAVDEQVTLDFDGQQVTASREVLKNTVPGEVKTFEVIKVSESEIELKLADMEEVYLKQTIRAVLVPNTDWETVLSQKEQNAILAEKEQRTREIMNQLQVISTSFTENDCDLLEQEGFPIETMTIHGLYQAISRVKVQQRRDGIVKEEVPEKLTQEVIAFRLKEENLPVTDKNISEVSKALTLCEIAGRMDDKAKRHLIDQDSEPTIENIYKAYYSGSKKAAEQKQELTEKEWKELLPQVKAVIQESGFEVTEENLQEAKWLLDNKLPLTKKTFSYKKELEEIKSSANSEMVFDRIIEGMKNGILPKNVSLAIQDEEALQQTLTNISSISPEAVSYAVFEGIDLTLKKLAAVQEGINSGVIKPSEPPTEKSAKQMPEEAEASVRHKRNLQHKDISENGPEIYAKTEKKQEAAVIDRATVGEDTAAMEDVREDNKLTSEATEEASVERMPAGTADGQDMSQDEAGADIDRNRQYEAVRAQRQMEEIRLKMTLEAATRLEKKGISIETQRLERVVEELRRLENSYYERLLKEAEVPATTEAVDTLRAASQSLGQLSHIPISTIGATLAERGSLTLPGLLTEGLKLQAEYTKAGIAYETLMTVPNVEYGDSIRKAFSHMASLLAEMNIEDTEQNQRAVRILGYNQMEITKESIEQVKAYDSEVTALINNLHPAVTVRMIKEGFNPLNMTISELNDKIDAMKEEQGISSEDKFSTYLHKLEKAEEITPEERKAYIGIYRLLYNVEKSDGAALGAVIKADREVTLSNLLTAVQTGKKGRMNTIIDDEFGTLTQMTRNKESIAEQLSGFMNTTEHNSAKEMSLERAGRLEEQTKYLERILKQITKELSPEKLSTLSQEFSQRNTDNTAIAENSTPAGMNRNIWEVIKDVPAEQLLQKLFTEQENATAAGEIYSEKVQQLRELCGKAEQSIRFLNDFQVSTTPQNITLANYILTNGASPIVRLLKKQSEGENENLSDGIKKLEDLSDSINDKSSMNEAYETLEGKARQLLERACAEETLDSRRLTELRSTAVQMSFLRAMAAREFYQIPIETANGITNINLTILRGSEENGRVSATVFSEQLGDIKADFSLKQQILKGFISCDSRSGLKKLQANSEEIVRTAKDNNLIMKQMDFGISYRDNDTYIYQNPENGQQNSKANNQTERMLYRIAKAIVQTVRLAEDSEEEASQAVS